MGRQHLRILTLDLDANSLNALGESSEAESETFCSGRLRSTSSEQVEAQFCRVVNVLHFAGAFTDS